MSAFGGGSINALARPWGSKLLPIDYKRCCSDRLSPPPKADIVTSSRLVDHLVSCVVNYDGRLEILKLWLASKGGLDSFLKFRPMPQLRGLDAFPVVNPAAATRFFIKQECFTDQIWISSPTRYRKAILRNSFFAAHSIWQAKQHDLRNHGATSSW